MNERQKADLGAEQRHPVMRLIIENPISALNAAMILVGGGIVWATNESRIKEVESRVVRIEQQVREDIASSTIKDERAALKVETITRDLGDLKVTIRGIEASTQFLVQQVQQQMRQQDRRQP